jgi:hypothetical protein
MTINDLRDVVVSLAMEDPHVLLRAILEHSALLGPEQREELTHLWLENGDLEFQEEWATAVLLKRSWDVLAREKGIIVDCYGGELHGEDELESLTVEDARELLAGRL